MTNYITLEYTATHVNVVIHEPKRLYPGAQAHSPLAAIRKHRARVIDTISFVDAQDKRLVRDVYSELYDCEVRLPSIGY